MLISYIYYILNYTEILLYTLTIYHFLDLEYICHIFLFLQKNPSNLQKENALYVCYIGCSGCCRFVE